MTIEITLEPNPTVPEMQATLVEIRDAISQGVSDYDLSRLQPIVDQYTTALRAHEWSTEQRTSNGPQAATLDISGAGRGWADEVAQRLVVGEQRAINAGDIGVPSVVSPNVVDLPRAPNRLIDLLANRQQVTDNWFQYTIQTVRTNNAAPVADTALKPTSVYTVTDVSDRLRTIAHVSEDVPNRIFEDHSELEQWLRKEMYEGVVDETESQIVSGDGIGENFTGVLNVAGVSTQAFTTSVPITLRKARTKLEQLGEQPTAYVLNPVDNEGIDLLTAPGSGEYLVNNGLGNIFGGVRRVVSNSVPQGTALLGNWSVAKLYYRDNIELKVDPYTKMKNNLTYMLAEWRSNFALLRPQAIVVIDLTA